MIHHTNYTYNLLAAAHSILTCVRTTNISELIYGFPEDLRSALKWQWINLSADNETLERIKEFWMLFNRMIYIDGLPAARTSYADVKVRVWKDRMDGYNIVMQNSGYNNDRRMDIWATAADHRLICFWWAWLNWWLENCHFTHQSKLQRLELKDCNYLTLRATNILITASEQKDFVVRNSLRLWRLPL